MAQASWHREDGAPGAKAQAGLSKLRCGSQMRNWASSGRRLCLHPRSHGFKPWLLAGEAIIATAMQRARKRGGERERETDIQRGSARESSVKMC